MAKVKKILYVIFSIIAIFLAVCSIASVLRNTDSRYLKMLDFPRIQFFFASLISLVIFFIATKKWKWYDTLLTVALLIGLLVNGSYLINYTSLVSVAVPSATEIKASEVSFSLLISNVKMSNRNSQPLIDLIAHKNPDLVLAMEVDEWWNEQLKVMGKNYSYSQHAVNEVAYGMVLYSKFPLKDIEVRYLQNKNVPSFHGTIDLADGKNFKFHFVHPVPPTQFKDLPDNEGQQEVALIKVGKELESRKYPSLLAGDLNDVVWSHVDVLTETENILYDVRVGRGIYSSYNAESIFMRWPLDHVLVTEEFKLKTIERLPKIDSDHFPIYVELVL